MENRVIRRTSSTSVPARGGGLALHTKMGERLKALAATLVLVGALAGGAHPAAASGWQVVASPNQPLTNNLLDAVACTSSTNCWAAGFVFGNLTTNQALMEHYDGTSWSIVSTPNTSTSPILNSVKCVSSTLCWAAGYQSVNGHFQTLIEQFNGTSWSIVSSPNKGTSGSFLGSVTCTSKTRCWAVGSYNRGAVSQTLVERYNGSTWTVVSSPNTSISKNNFLNSVACSSTTNCWAAGAAGKGTPLQTLTEHYNGTSWSIVASPDVITSQDNLLNSVTCPLATSCWAAGYYIKGTAAQTLVEHYNGTAWSIVASPDHGSTQDNVLNSVACTTATICQAVGYYHNGSADQTLVEAYSGTSWSIVSSPDSAAHLNRLLSVACTSSTNCWTIGNYYTGAGEQTLIEHYNGASWSVVNSQNNDPAPASYLTSVTCSSSTSCWAAGYYFNGTPSQTLIEQYDGTSWGVVPSANANTMSNYLKSVTCTSTTSCWAAGFYSNGAVPQTLVERYDGTSWSLAGSPNTSASDTNQLFGVACTSTANCWAVGFYRGTSTPDQTLVEHFDGTSWSIVASPNSSPVESNALSSVTCVSTTDCWAVGDYATAQGLSTLVEQFDGTSWNIVSSPSTSPGDTDYLTSVACPAANNCWAAGYAVFNNGVTTVATTLIEQWDGTSWTIASSPDSGTGNNTLHGLTCASTSSCWAVGYFASSSGWQTLIVQYDGTSWSVVSSPNSGAGYNELNGVACISTTDCWSAGDLFGSGGNTTLIERGP